MDSIDNKSKTSDHGIQAFANSFHNILSETRGYATVIYGFAELLRRGTIGSLNNDQQEMVEQLRERTAMLAHFMDQAVLLHEIDVVDDLRENTRCSIGDIITEVIAHTTNRDINPDVITTFAQPKEDIFITICRDDVSRALFQCLHNAIRYNKPQGTVHIATDSTQSEIGIHIQDTGYGIPNDQQHHLFKRHGRLSCSNVPIISESGLGLYIAKVLIERNNGHITFTSKEGSGSVFSIHLPREQT